MMEPNESLPVQIKANRSGLTLVPAPDVSFESIMAYLAARLKESREFFQRSEMTLDLRLKPLRTDEILRLHHLLQDYAGVKVTEIRMEDDLSFFQNHGAGRTPVAAKPSRTGTGDTAPVIVRNTCRSGAHIVSPSDCVILGDVNPGAEILATGDIIVFGNLRGIAHAGVEGNRSARIWALSIEPSQIRIADMVAVPPGGGKPTPKRFEMAEIQDDIIEVITI
ncbi:MAG: septum site-determining protein MinC [Syntrophobacteraceae bacterium]|nr:septum site-determining protein MinC [Syntrophobacteraceae bacterium]